MYAWLGLREHAAVLGLQIGGSMLVGVLDDRHRNGFVVWAQTGLPSASPRCSLAHCRCRR